MRTLTGFAFAIALSCTAPPAWAQVSFSSFGANINQGGWVRYSGARLYSEDNRDFRFEALGCAWTLGRELRREQDYVRHPRNSAQELGTGALHFRWAFEETAGNRMDYQVHLVGGRTSGSSSSLRPRGFACGDRAVLAFAMLQGTPHAYLLYHAPGGVGASGFSMRRDWLTPNQRADAWRFAGDVALSIFQAWVSSR